MTTYIFINNSYDLKWSSMNFYFQMMNKIRTILVDNGHNIINLNNIDDIYKDIYKDFIFFIDPVVIITLHYKHNLEKLINLKYILIIGENIENNTFMGWNNESLKALNFSPNNILLKIIENAYKVTYQNSKVLDLLNKIGKSSDTIYFFPIDGYLDEYIIENTINKKDIDILIYGAMCYERRVNFFKNLAMKYLPYYKIVVLNNIFDIDNFLSRSKIIIHINSLNNCYHVPYAKIIKLLANNKITLVEKTPDLMKSDLKKYVHIFDLVTQDESNNHPMYVTIIKNLINNYMLEQQKINQLNAQKYIKDNYNFIENVISLVKST
jgi:hypothetical protein